MDKGDETILQSLMKSAFIESPNAQPAESQKTTDTALKPESGLPHDLQNIPLYDMNVTSDSIQQNTENKEKITEPPFEDHLISNTTELSNLFQNSFTDLPPSQLYLQNSCTAAINDIGSAASIQVQAQETSPQQTQIQNEDNSRTVIETVSDSSTLAPSIQVESSVPVDINNKPCISSNIQQTEQNVLASEQTIIDEIIGRSSAPDLSQNIFVGSDNVTVLNSPPLTTQQLSVNNTPNVNMRMDISENIFLNKESSQFSSNPVSTMAVTLQEILPVSSGGHMSCGSDERQSSNVVTVPGIVSPNFTTQSVFINNSQKNLSSNIETQSNMASVSPISSFNLFGGKSSTQTSNSHFFQNPIQSSNVGIQNLQNAQPPNNQHLMNVLAPSLEAFGLQIANNPPSMSTSTSQIPSLTSQHTLTEFQNKLTPLTVMTSLSAGSVGTNTVQCVNSKMQTIICTPTSSHILTSTSDFQPSSTPNISVPAVCTSQVNLPENLNIKTSAPLQNIMVVSAVDQNTSSISQLSGSSLFTGQQVNSNKPNTGIISNNPIPVQTYNIGNTLILAPVAPINKSNTPAAPLILGTPLQTLMTPITSQNAPPKSDMNFVQIINNVNSSVPTMQQQMSFANAFSSAPNVTPNILDKNGIFSFGASSPIVSLESSTAVSSGSGYNEKCSEPEIEERIDTSSTNTFCTSSEQSSLAALNSEKESLLRQCLEGRIDFQTSTPNTHLSVSQASSPDYQLTLSSPDATDVPSPLSSPKVTLEHTTQHSLIDKSKRLHLNSETVPDETEDPREISIYYPDEGEIEDRVKVQKLKQHSDASSAFSQNINFNKLLDSTQEEDSGAKKFSFFGFGLDESVTQQPKTNTEVDPPSQICSPPIAQAHEPEQGSSFDGGKESKLINRPAKEYSLTTQFAYKVHGYELEIKSQPEEQHRARYLTEGSRGAVKDRSGTGHPVIKLNGCRRPAKLQVFIGCDAGRVRPHGFYQACKISGKNATPAVEREIEGTTVIEMDILPVNDMITSIDNVGILKLRNADVERRIGVTKAKKKKVPTATLR